MEQFTYAIGDKTYIQRPLVLGQINQLIAVMHGIIIPREITVQSIIAILGSRMPKALAIVLHEAEKSAGKTKQEVSRYLMDRALQPLADEIEFNLEPETLATVVNDFFDCNPIVSIIERFGRLGEKLKLKLPKMTAGISSSSSSPSPAATSPGGTPSSGATLSESAGCT